MLPLPRKLWLMTKNALMSCIAMLFRVKQPEIICVSDFMILLYYLVAEELSNGLPQAQALRVRRTTFFWKWITDD